MPDFTGLHDLHGFLLSEDDVAAMRQWIGDCVWADLDDELLAELTPAEVAGGVKAYYEGGILAFLDTLWAELRA